MKRSPAWKTGPAGLLIAALAACGGGDGGPAPLSIDGHGVSTVDAGALGSPLATDPLQTPLSAAERASLLFMREEEQLAHDVYAASANRMSLPVFSNIASSETSHSVAVAALLVRYGVPDPMDARPTGTFATAQFQALHDSLVAASTVSLVEALKVGVEIEELDIRDIEAQKAGIDNADILMVYDQLLRGSRNHLRAFMKVLEQQGGSYAPKYISQAAFDAIVDSATETGS
jgi:hypothetical protein